MGIEQCFDLLSLLSDLSVLTLHPRVLTLHPRGQLLDLSRLIRLQLLDSLVVLLRNLSDAFEMARLLSFDLTLEFFDLTRLLANFSS